MTLVWAGSWPTACVTADSFRTSSESVGGMFGAKRHSPGCDSAGGERRRTAERSAAKSPPVWRRIKSAERKQEFPLRALTSNPLQRRCEGRRHSQVDRLYPWTLAADPWGKPVRPMKRAPMPSQARPSTCLETKPIHDSAAATGSRPFDTFFYPPSDNAYMSPAPKLGLSSVWSRPTCMDMPTLCISDIVHSQPNSKMSMSPLPLNSLALCR